MLMIVILDYLNDVKKCMKLFKEKIELEFNFSKGTK